MASCVTDAFRFSSLAEEGGDGYSGSLEELLVVLLLLVWRYFSEIFLLESPSGSL